MFSNKFVQASEKYCTYDQHVNAPLMRRSFYVEDVTKGKITIAGLGFYRLFINGEEITKSHLAPYISNLNDYVYYDEYDLANYLVLGKNVIGIILGNGMLNSMGGYTWGFDNANYRSAPKVAFALEIDNKIIEADDLVLVHDSPITFDDLRAGERYDANLEINDWNQIDYDDSSWRKSIPSTAPSGEKRIANIYPIKEIKEIKPIKIIKNDTGYIYDFGINTAAIVKLSINGIKNQKIRIQHGEIVKNNKLDLTNIVFRGSKEEYNQCLIYTCKEGYQEYKPSFTYMGFRYVYIEGINEEQANEDLLTMIELHTNLNKIGDFNCSNEDLNKIYKNTINSTLSNFHHFPTDCPQREKNGWTGDINLSCDQMMMNFNASKNIKEWLKNVQKAQLESGQIPGIIPTYRWGYDWGHGPGWDSVITETLYRIYQYENDTEVLKDNYQLLWNYVRYLSKKINEEGLVCYGLGDWCEVEAKGPDKFLTPLCVTDTLISINIFRKAEKIFNVLSCNGESEFCKQNKEKLLNNFREKCINEKLEVLGNTQTAQAMAIYYGAFKKEEEKKAVSNLIKLIEKFDNHFQVGVLGGRALFRVLAKHGYIDLAYKLITNETFPSFSWQLKRGATSLWESFYNMDEELNMYSNMTFEVLSMNHHFWGDVSAFFIEYILGLKVNPNVTNYNEIIIEPKIVKDLSYAEGYHIMPYGKVYIKWQKHNDKIRFEIIKPEGCKCTFKYNDVIHEVNNTSFNIDLDL